MPTKEELEFYYQDTRQHILNVQREMQKAIINLSERAQNHDSSKYDVAEAHTYAKVVPMFKGKVYGTPEHKAVGDLLGDAWNHHEMNNDHHPGYYYNGMTDMNLLSIIEMLCDWKAASLRNPNQSFVESCVMNCEKYGADKQLTNIILNTAKKLSMFEDWMYEYAR